MSRIDTSLECFGCGVCTAICPKHCIDMKMTKDGFLSPNIDDKLCIDCGLCARICSFVTFQNNDKSVIEAFSVYAKDDAIRKSCSSGGVAHLLADKMAQDGVSYFGAVYDTQTNGVEHIIAKTNIEREKIKGSKYLQSNIQKNLPQIFKSGKYIIVGTPCQIASIRNIASLKKKEDNLLLVDFFCHGVPSDLLWKVFLKEMHNRYKTIKFDNIAFRDKQKGWHSFVMRFDIKNQPNRYYAQSEGNMFYRFFLSNSCLGKSCYKCKFHHLESQADLRIGDLWGEKYKKDDKGVSGVLALTKKGKEAIKQLENDALIVRETQDIVTEGQIKEALPTQSNRGLVLWLLRQGLTLKAIYSIAIFPFRVQKFIKRKITRR